jgi:hypothetical protein
MLPALNIWEEALPTGHLTNPGSKPLGTERAKHYDASGILKTPIGLLRSHFTCLRGGGLRYKGLVPARAICGCTSPHVSAALVLYYRGFSGGKGSGHVDTTKRFLPLLLFSTLRSILSESYSPSTPHSGISVQKAPVGLLSRGFSRRQGFFANTLRLCIHQVTQHHINLCFDPA